MVQRGGGRISDFESRNSNLSTDGTREFLDGLKKEFGDKISIIGRQGRSHGQAKRL